MYRFLNEKRDRYLLDYLIKNYGGESYSTDEKGVFMHNLNDEIQALDVFCEDFDLKAISLKLLKIEWKEQCVHVFFQKLN